MKIIESLKRNGVEVVVTAEAGEVIGKFEGAHISIALSADEKTGVIFFGGFEERIKAGLAEHHVVVLKEEDVKNGIVSAYRHAVSKSDVVFASSSASKTADIEGKTVSGVHGPQKFTVIVEVRK
ncbi:LUD domain-containing protein [Archaeoglobus neptunius]|uniref:LUD domain-containing protein n=1 Tax=Archaeoglobus neptunius TaxID=2798580 RepID=UPI00192871BA|nr:LUD domain-containing protein [Archaeoglobus neptunius]